MASGALGSVTTSTAAPAGRRKVLPLRSRSRVATFSRFRTPDERVSPLVSVKSTSSPAKIMTIEAASSFRRLHPCPCARQTFSTSNSAQRDFGGLCTEITACKCNFPFQFLKKSIDTPYLFSWVTASIRTGAMKEGFPGWNSSIDVKVSTSRSFGVRLARTTLSLSAMHSTQSPLMYACGTFGPIKKLSPSWRWR